MTRRMLIDAAHPEETRVVVLHDRQLVDFDFETSTKRQLKGNIYLAKVTRVEPSLQAAFVDYGGNRHGFLAFSEIHPDYFQVPQADREMLEQLEREAAAKATQAENESFREQPRANGEAGEAGEAAEITQVTQDAEEETAEVVDEFARRRSRLLRSYKIQEVIKRRQILLVQVVKEERGNKGAALTTYLSLAGRYCVLMPNTPRGGGISRKIASSDDRTRLKEIATELDVPSGMGLIVRTAGAERTKAEIKRDYEYLLRVWSEVRETTLSSVAPCMIYEEGDLIKRALRDLYTREIEEVLVEGEAGYKAAKRLMGMLMPSRARQIKPYTDEIPLFFRYPVEDQLDGMYSPVVHLPAGGSIVIHVTEALTAIDVNSGRSTRERHIDETAVKTNLEAADEIARQLRLRDIAGLIVVDFIDMAEGRHIRSVEKRMRDALKNDRARIQIGRISMFGLMEMSRQRLRPSLQELAMQVCPHCHGMGVIRSTESCALQSLRLVQDAGIRHETKVLQVRLPTEVGLYLLNHKRELLVRLEQRYDMRVDVVLSEGMAPPHMELTTLERREEPAEPVAEPARAEAAPAERETRRSSPLPVREVAEEEATQEEAPEEEVETAADDGRPTGQPQGESAEGGPKKRRRRRRRRRRGGEEGQTGPQIQGQEDGQEEYEEDGGEAEGGEEEPSEQAPGPDDRPTTDEPWSETPPLAASAQLDEHAAPARDGAPDVELPVEPAVIAAPLPVEEAPTEAIATLAPSEAEPVAEESVAKPKPKRAPRKRKTKAQLAAEAAAREAAEAEAGAEPVAAVAETAPAEPEPTEPEPDIAEVEAREPEPPMAPLAADSEMPSAAPEEATSEAEPEPAAPIAPQAEEPRQPARQGWWSRLVRTSG